MTRFNLATLPAIERQRIELDKRASFLMWSLVLQQPRKRGEPPMTRPEIGRELLDQRFQLRQRDAQRGRNVHIELFAVGFQIIENTDVHLSS